jgi:glycine cleavage system H protein
MNIPENLLYTETHEWIHAEDNIATVGISDFAQQQLGDITFVELPEVGDEFAPNDEIAVVESVKAASDIYSPLSGKVVEVNKELDSTPELVNSDPYIKGWLFKIEISDQDELASLMSGKEYETKQ